MNTDTKRQQFLEAYQMICEEFGMYVGAWCSPSGMDMGLCLEEALSQEELEEHLKEVEESS
jgi:hypothetical protein